MRLRRVGRPELPQPFRGPGLELGREVAPFVFDLPPGHGQLSASGRFQLGGVETVASAHGLGVDLRQVGSDGPAGIGALAEPEKLRVLPVAAGQPGQHRPGQQGLAPLGHQAPGVEVAGVQGPQSQVPSSMRAMLSVSVTPINLPARNARGP